MVEKDAGHIRSTMRAMINPNFGSVFRTQNNPTSFGYSVEKYVDVYTSRLENFLLLPPDYRFVPQRKSLPHEPFGQEQFKALSECFEGLSASTST
jgi:hypothetical protein